MKYIMWFVLNLILLCDRLPSQSLPIVPRTHLISARRRFKYPTKGTESLSEKSSDKEFSMQKKAMIVSYENKE